MIVPKNGMSSSVDIVEIHNNTSQHVISITEDRLRLILLDYFTKMESNKGWQVPFGLLVTIVLVFCSAEFKQAFGFSASTWTAVFLIGGVACVVWLLICLFKLHKAPTLDRVIASIKNKTE